MPGGAPIGVQLDVVRTSDGRKIEVAFATLVRNRADASWSAPIRFFTAAAAGHLGDAPCDSHRLQWSRVCGNRRPDGLRNEGDRGCIGSSALRAPRPRTCQSCVSYHEFVIGMHRSHQTVPTIPAWLVCDREFIEKYGLGR